jgi:hypothetical protein
MRKIQVSKAIILRDTLSEEKKAYWNKAEGKKVDNKYVEIKMSKNM